MKLWLVTRTDNGGYDTFDSIVVVSSTEDEAKLIPPDGDGWGWTTPDRLTVKFIGEADAALPAGVVLASFNAG